MPIAKGLMTFLPSVHLYSFLIIGLGVVVLSFLALGYVRTHFEKLILRLLEFLKNNSNLSVFSALLVCEEGLVYGKMVL